MAAWQTETVEMLRGLIFDLSDTPDFTDQELLRVIVIAASYVSREASFAYSFAVDISEQEIDPDPSSTDYKDTDFLNFVALKAACLLNIGQARIKTAQAILIKDDKNTVDFKGVADHAITFMREGYCKIYQRAMLEYRLNNTAAAAEAILSPFRTVLGGHRRITFYKS